MLTVLLSILSATPTPELAVGLRTQPSTLRPTFEARLRPELPDGVRLLASTSSVANTAALRVDVRRLPKRLRVEMTRSDGSGRQVREFAIDGNPTAALRLAVRVTVERITQALRLRVDRRTASDDPPRPPPPTATSTAAAAAEPPAPTTVTPTDESPPTPATADEDNAPREASPPSERPPAAARGERRVDVRVGFGTMLWSRPSAAQLGVEAAVDLRFGRWRFGLTGAAYGLGCCEMTTEDLEAKARVLYGALHARRRFALSARWAVAPFLEAGVVSDHADVNPIRFAGETQPPVAVGAKPGASRGRRGRRGRAASFENRADGRHLLPDHPLAGEPAAAVRLRKP